MDKIIFSGFGESRCSSDFLKDKLFLVGTQLVCLLFLAGAVYGILGGASLPGTEIFALLLLAASAWMGGVLVSFLKLPPLLGMLAVGIFFRNTPFIPYHADISIMWASTLRDISLVIILLKAGLGLDPPKLLELKLDVIKLSFIPCLFEAASSAVLVHYFLDLPWIWSFMLGFIVSAVSAAVLVPGMLELEEKGLGLETGIPTLLMAAVSIDNIVALTGFIVTFSIITSNENLTWTLITRTLEPFIGLLMGTIIGAFLWYLPSENTTEPVLVFYRSSVLCLGGLCFTFVSKRVGMAGAGALACVSFAFIASLKWRPQEHFKHVTYIIGIMWNLIEPFLFGLIGAEITLNSLGNNLGYASLALCLGVLIRVISTIFALLGSKLNLKEKTFVSVSWIAKATVQAAVGSQALDYARSHRTEPNFKEYSQQVLMMSVLSIILTAPLGAAFIDWLAPHLLNTDGTTSSSTSPDSLEEDEREQISEVTVTDYGARRSASVGEIEGFIRGLKSGVNV